MNKPILVIMAAGLGSRYGGLKQMAKIGSNSETIIHYSIYYAYKAGFKKVIFIIRESFYKEFKDFIGNFSKKFMDVEYVFQDNKTIKNIIDKKFFTYNRLKPLGTAHALYSIKNNIKNNSFVLINSDDFYSYNSFINIFDFLTTNIYDQCMISYLLKNTLSNNGIVSRGVCSLNENNYLKEIKEIDNICIIDNEIFSKNKELKIKLNYNSHVSMNMWGFNKNIFNELEIMLKEFCNKTLMNDPLNEEFKLPVFINHLLKTQKINVKVILSLDKWFGITYKNDLIDIINYFKKYNKYELV